METPTVLILAGTSGAGPLEQLLTHAKEAAMADAIAALSTLPAPPPIILAHSPQLTLALPPFQNTSLTLQPDPQYQQFHFGRRLAEVIGQYQLNQVFYMGAGSLPLLSTARLAGVMDQLQSTQEPTVITNNVRSADWVAFNHAANIQAIVPWLTRDNMLAWRLRENLNYKVVSLPPSAATRLDIDTPFDLQVLALHPQAGPYLKEYLGRHLPRLNLERIQSAIQALQTPGRRVTLIGRVPPTASDLLGARQHWTRVFSEERGMVAAQRQEERQVFSLIADHIQQVGEAEFVNQLARTSDLVLFDTRVFLAHHSLWPPDEERFASDLGDWEKVSPGPLQALTKALSQAPMPVLLGGHNVVSGGLYALLELAGR